MLEQFTIAADIAGEDRSYELSSIIVHQGLGGGGHYVSLQKIDGVWYHFNDYEACIATPQQMSEALSHGYGYFYSARNQVDPAAVRISSAIEQPSLMTEALTSELDELNQIKETLLQCTDEDVFFSYFSRISSSAQSLIFDELKSQMTSDSQVLDMMGKDYAHEGAMIIERNSRILSSVFHENDGGFGEIEFNSDPYLIDHYSLLLIELHQEPVDHHRVKELLQAREFADVARQIKEAVFASAISQKIAGLAHQELFKQCLPIVDHFINIKQKESAESLQVTPSAAHSVAAKEMSVRDMLKGKGRSETDQIHTQLCKSLLTTRQRYKERLENPVQTGRKMLDKDLTKLHLVLKEHSLRKVFDTSFSPTVSEKEKGDFKALMNELSSNNKDKLNKLFNKSNISTATRNEFRRFVCLADVAENVEADAREIMFGQKELEQREKEILRDALMRSKR
jgi:hypothetical protein